MQAYIQTRGIQCIAQQQTTQTLHKITPHEQETNTNLKDLKIGQIQTHVKKLKFLLKIVQNVA